MKFLKPGKVVLVLRGKYAGRKAILLKQYDDGTSDRTYPHALIVGIKQYPRKVTKQMGKKKLQRRMKIKPFLKVSAYTHLLPTRYVLDLELDKEETQKKESKVAKGRVKQLANKDSLKDSGKKRTAVEALCTLLDEKYRSGKNKWFFNKLRF